MKLFGYEISKANRKEATYGQYKMQGDGLPPSGEKSYQDNLKRIYNNNTVAACVTKLVTTLPEAPLKVRQGDILTDKHEVINLFNKPNTYQSQATLLQLIALHYTIGGNAYIHKVVNGLGRTVELHVYSDQQIQPIISPTKNVEEYLYNFNNQKFRIPANEIIHLRSPMLNPSRPYLGLSPLTLCGTASDINGKLNNSIYSVLENGGVPTTWLQYKGQGFLDETQIKSVKEQYRQITKNNQNGKNELGILGGAFDKIIESPIFKDYDLPNLWTRSDSEVCAAFGIPPVVLGVFAGLSNMTYDNYKQGVKQFTESVRIPIWNLWEEQITRSFQTEFPNVVVEFDLSQVQALLPDADKLSADTVAQVTSGIITPSEARIALGYADSVGYGVVDKLNNLSPLIATAVLKNLTINEQRSLLGLDAIDGGDVISNQTNVVKDTNEDVQISNELLNAVNGVKGAIKTDRIGIEAIGITEEKAVGYWKSYDDISTTATEHLSIQLMHVITELGNEVIKQQKKKIDWQAWEKKFLKATETEREKLIVQVMNQAWKDADTLEDLGDSETNIFVQATKDSAEKITESVGTIRDEIQEILKKNAGRTGAELVAILKDKFETLANSRAALIARTTATATTSGTQQKVWSEYNNRQTDNKNKIVRVWLSSRDAKTRNAHRDADGQRENKDGMFTINGNKTPYPAGGNLPASDACNCRCTTIARKVKDLK